jgi:NAD(P)-dependent dehydrogenase (short-subunit alcohol dehydrogenase family)
MSGKTCLVTGATSGIGRATALGLARLGATVIVVGRDQRRGETAVNEIKASTGNASVHLLCADLSSQAEVRRLANEVQAGYPRLHVLVNNAGGVFARRTLTADGIEMTFALNHLAYFLLTNLLLDLLRAGAPARIVNVTSEAQRNGTIEFDDLQGAERYGGFRAYSQSKLANLLFTYELARRLGGASITANAVHPGAVRTGFGLNNRGWLRVLMYLVRPFERSPERGAETPIYLASAPELEGVTGKYFIDKKEARSSRESYDHAVAERLWQVSERLTNLSPAAG